MKRKYYIRFLFILLTLSPALSGFAQRTQVFEWIGGSGKWSDLSHWSVAGLPATVLPSGKNTVLIEAGTNALEISLETSKEVNGLFILGNVTISAISRKDIEIQSALVIDQQAYIMPTVMLEFNGLAEHSVFDVPEKFHSQIQALPKGYVKKPVSAAPRANGACPYFTIVPDPVAPTCNGFNNGIASVLQPTDGVGPYTYQWIGGPPTRQWSNIGAGTYTVIVRDLGQGIIAQCNTDVFVNEPGPLTVFSMNATAPLCAGICDGSASPLVIGGNGGYSFNWSSGETGASANQLCPTFILTITDQEGCIFDTTFVFPDPPQPIVFNATITDVACFGDDDGSIDVTTSGGSGNINISWTGPSGFTSADLSIANLEPGTYLITAQDENACVSDSSFTVSQNPTLTATAAVTDNICADQSQGSISLTPGGGQPPYSFAWSGPNGFTSTTQDISGLESGSYEVTLTDDSGCIFVLVATVAEPLPVSIAITFSNEFCFGGNSGSAAASASDGTPGYTYAWSGPDGFTQTGPSISNLSAGTYVVDVTDANSCSFLDSVEIAEPISIQLSAVPTAVTCQNGTNGAIDLSISGGVSPYSVLWSGPAAFSATSEDINGLSPGNYTAAVSDANGCTASLTQQLVNPPPIALSAIVTNNICASGNSGAIDLSVSNGTAPYAYLWSGPSGYINSSQDISNLFAGTYTVSVTGANGCNATASYTITSPGAITATFTKLNLQCFGASTGSINVTPSGGATPYSFLWVGPMGYFSMNQNISNLLAGSYSLQVTDANGCFSFFTVNLSQPPKINITGPVTNVNCFGASNGAVDAIVNGGTPGYSYAWIGPNGFTSTQQDITGVLAGDYTLTVTDTRGCTRSRTFSITQPAQIIITGASSNVVCSGDSDGSITISVAGGVSPYAFAWSGPGGFSSSAQNISNLSAGNYFLTVTGNNGCTQSASFTISETVVLVIDGVTSDVSCFAAADGSVNLTISGGAEPYTITWSGPTGFSSSDADIVSLEPGSYTVSVQDASGCEEVQTFDINEPDLLEINLVANAISCSSESDGSIISTVSGGSAPYTYSWSGPEGFVSTNENLTNLAPGTYTLMLADGNGCPISATAEVIEPDSLGLTLDIVQPNCLIDDGSISVNAFGGTVGSDYSYSFINGSGTVIGTTSILSNLAPDLYVLTLNDDNGCQLDTTIELTRITFDLSSLVQDVTCFGIANGSISINPNSGISPFSFTWSGPNSFSSNDQNISDLEMGIYNLSAVDADGCLLETSYQVLGPTALTLNATVLPETCPGNSNGSIDLAVSGGSPGYTISWSGPDGFSATDLNLSNLAPGDYFVQITDSNACQRDTLITVPIGSDFQVDLTPTNPTCAGGASGMIEADVTPLSGTPLPFTYAWTGPDGYASSNEDISGLIAGEYIVMVTGSGGCERSDTITLVEPDPIVLNVTSLNSNCLQSDGSAIASANGGNGLVTYEWSDEDGNTLSNTNELISVGAGVYTLIATDELGCTATDAVLISDSNGSVEGIVMNTNCSETADGSIDITVLEGTPPFTFEWEDDTSVISTNEDLNGLAAGDYTVRVTDSNGCLYAATFEVLSPLPISVSVDEQLVTCVGNDGSIALTISGGFMPYNVDWTGPAGFIGNGATIIDLLAGTYDYSISDFNGCVLTGAFVLETVPELVSSPVKSDILCFGDASGSISLDLSGGLQPYVISWTGPDDFSASTQNISSLVAGQYVANVVDANNCTRSDTILLLENSAIVLDIDAENPDCGSDDGSIRVGITGGVVATSYTVIWSDQSGNFISSDTTLTNLSIGIYTLSVTDDNGCSTDTVITLSNPDADIVAVVDSVQCFGENSGSILLQVSGVTEPYTISWQGPDTFTGDSVAILDLYAGSYDYILTGADNCSYVGSVEVLSPDELSLTAISQNTCFSTSEGSIDLTVTGGSAPLIFEWNGPDGYTSSLQDVDDLSAGAYQLVISDQNGCSLDSTFNILENGEITILADVSGILCYGDTIGSIDITLSGGQAPYNVLWSAPDGFTSTEEDLFDITASTYTLEVTDALGCQKDTSIVLVDPDTLTVLQAVVPAGCSSPFNLGQISLIAEGGTPEYVVSWTGPNSFTSDQLSISNLEPGIFSYELADANGCTIVDQIEIVQVTPITVDFENSEPSCNGIADGSISVGVSGGIAPYSIDWTGPDGFTAVGISVDNVLAGVYTITISDSSGCVVDFNNDFLEPDSLIILSLTVQDAFCNTSYDGGISAIVDGGTPNYTYSWIGPNGFTTAEGDLDSLLSGVYELTLTDANNCVTSAVETVGFSLEINVDAGSDLVLCESSLPFEVFGSGSNTDSYNWMDGEGNLLSENDTLSLTAAVGLQNYILSGSNGLCETTDTLSVEVLAAPAVNAGFDREVFPEETFTLGGSPTSVAASDYNWSPAALGPFNVQDANPTGYLLTSTLFIVMATDDNGCVGSDSVFVKVLPELNITSGFTPNDDGKNDTWIIDNMELFPKNVVNVFSRWGEAVYSADGYNSGNAWDGTFEGAPLPIGTYYYTIELNDNRFPNPFTGPITIYR